MSVKPVRNLITQPATDGRDFAELRGRLLDIVHHLQCADFVLYYTQDVPEELQPACSVLHRAVTELDALYDELDSWHATHEHQRKLRMTEAQIRARTREIMEGREAT